MSDDEHIDGRPAHCLPDAIPPDRCEAMAASEQCALTKAELAEFTKLLAEQFVLREVLVRWLASIAEGHTTPQDHGFESVQAMFASDPFLGNVGIAFGTHGLEALRRAPRGR